MISPDGLCLGASFAKMPCSNKREPDCNMVSTDGGGAVCKPMACRAEPMDSERGPPLIDGVVLCCHLERDKNPTRSTIAQACD